MGDTLQWIKPGAEVVMYSMAHGSTDASVTTIDRVHKVTFTVKGSTRKFGIVDGYSKESGSWSAGYKVVPPDSDEAVRALRRQEVYRQRQRVAANYGRWLKSPTFAHRQALIDALNAVDSDGE